MELKNVYPDKIPKKIIAKNYIDDIILYALSKFGPLLKAEFDKINKNTFYKYINKLLEKKLIYPAKREGKNAIYEITPSGQTELSIRLKNYKLDFPTLIELEKKRFQSLMAKLDPFFEEYNITDELIKIEFLQLHNAINYDEGLMIFSEGQFNLLLLYIVMNQVNIIKDLNKVLTIDHFIKKYDINHLLSKTSIKMFIQEVIDYERKDEKIYKLIIDKNKFLFFRANSELGYYFETTIKTHLRNLNYIKSLRNSEIFDSDLGEIVKLILHDITQKYNFFPLELSEYLNDLIEEYIFGMEFEFHEKTLVEIENIKDFHSIFSRFSGFHYMFEPLRDSNEDLIMDARSTFKRIKEREPINESFHRAMEFYNNNKSEEALIEIEKALAIDSQNFELLEHKSRILYDLKRYEDALKIYKNSLKVRSPLKDTHEKVYSATYLAEIHAWLKDYDKALKILNEEIPTYILEDNDYGIGEFLNDNYIDFEFYKIESKIYYELKDFKQALKTIDKDLDFIQKQKEIEHYNEEYVNEILVESLNLKEKILYKLSDIDESVKIIDESLRLNPKQPELYRKRILRSLNDNYEVIDDAIHYFPDYDHALFKKIQVNQMLRLGQRNEVVNQKLLNIIETIDDKLLDFQWYHIKAEIHFELNQFQDALISINKAIDTHKEQDGNGSYYLKATILYSLKREEETNRFLNNNINYFKTSLFTRSSDFAGLKDLKAIKSIVEYSSRHHLSNIGMIGADVLNEIREGNVDEILSTLESKMQLDQLVLKRIIDSIVIEGILYNPKPNVLKFNPQYTSEVTLEADKESKVLRKFLHGEMQNLKELSIKIYNAIINGSKVVTIDGIDYIIQKFEYTFKKDSKKRIELRKRVEIFDYEFIELDTKEGNRSLMIRKRSRHRKRIIGQVKDGIFIK